MNRIHKLTHKIWYSFQIKPNSLIKTHKISNKICNKICNKIFHKIWLSFHQHPNSPIKTHKICSKICNKICHKIWVSSQKHPNSASKPLKTWRTYPNCKSNSTNKTLNCCLNCKTSCNRMRPPSKINKTPLVFPSIGTKVPPCRPLWMIKLMQGIVTFIKEEGSSRISRRSSVNQAQKIPN